MATKDKSKWKTPAERAEAARLLRERLEQFERELTPEQEGEILARFMGYSERNAKLIAMQAAAHGITATDVAGFRAWKERGRQVLKRPDHVPEGEWGLKIIAPRGTKNDKKGKGEATGPARVVEGQAGDDGDRMFFGTATVFDIAQTEPLDEPGTEG